MSLLKAFARPCTVMVRTEESDGEGGRRTAWVEGATFENYQALDSQPQVTRAEQEGLLSQFSILTDQSAPVQYGDFFRDDNTGETFRITSEPADKMSPNVATFCLKYYTAEKKELPE